MNFIKKLFQSINLTVFCALTRGWCRTSPSWELILASTRVWLSQNRFIFADRKERLLLNLILLLTHLAGLQDRPPCENFGCVVNINQFFLRTDVQAFLSP